MTIGGAKHSNLKIKGNQGDDNITLAAGFAGKNNAVYGGKDEDTITLQTTEAVIVSGDAGDDVISSTGVVVTATITGADGDDSINNSASLADSAISIKGGKGDDTLTGSLGKDTIYGGKGDDQVGSATNTGADELYGDKGDDTILSASTTASMASGDGDDGITFTAVAAAAGEKLMPSLAVQAMTTSPLPVLKQAEGGSKDQDYDAADNTTILQYASGEFFEGNDLVDEITVGNNQAVIAEVSDELKITSSTDFSNFTVVGTRDSAQEGLIIKTAASVTGASRLSGFRCRQVPPRH